MELNRSNIIRRMQSKITTIEEFNFDRLQAPPLYALLSPYDIDRLYNIATSIRYSGNSAKKYKAMEEILKPRGFRKISAGTNRLCYGFEEDNRIAIKVAYQGPGLHDSPAEFRNQMIFKPFVTKIFEVSPCGTVGLVERVNPLRSKEEFLSVADDVYDLITKWLIGKYVLADIGGDSFLNYAWRESFGIVLCDFPYVYELDGNKLYCSAPDSNSPTGRCEGEIDYDDGFNFMRCEKCGAHYRVRELAKAIKDNNIIISGTGGKSKMKVSMIRNGVKVMISNDGDGLLENAKPAVQHVAKPGKTKVGTLKVSSGYVEKKPVTPPDKRAKKDSHVERLHPSTIVDYDRLSENYDLLLAEYKSLEKDYKAQTVLLEKMNMDIGELRKELKDADEAAYETSAEYSNLLKTNNSLLKDLEGFEELQKEKASLETICKSYESKIGIIVAEHQSELLAKNNEISELKIKLTDMEEAKESMPDVEKMKEEIDHLTGILEDEKCKMIELKGTVDVEREENEKLLGSLINALYSTIPLSRASKDEEDSIPEIENCNFINALVYPLNHFQKKKGFELKPGDDRYVLAFIDPISNDFMVDGSDNIVLVANINGYDVGKFLRDEEGMVDPDIYNKYFNDGSLGVIEKHVEEVDDNVTTAEDIAKASTNGND